MPGLNELLLDMPLTLPAIDFKKIRLHKGTQHGAFEELCCQLASLKLRPLDAKHFRKGLGRDAGVECFTRFADGTETGWQVKYTWTIKDLIPQLNKSIKSALKNHPRLAEYIVCIPFNLSDPGGDKTALKKWEDWVKKQQDLAKVTGRVIAFELWGATEIGERLGRDDPLYAGRVQYWFEEEHLTPAWFQENLARAHAGLGERYSPESNIELPIRRNLLSLARDPFLNETVDEWGNKLTENGRRALSAITKLSKCSVSEPPPAGLEGALERLADALASAPIDTATSFPLEHWIAAANDASKHALACQQWAWNEGIDKVLSSDADHCREPMHKLVDNIFEIQHSLESRLWKITNARQVLVFGDGGIGKSHLLADAAKYQIDHVRPALLFLGEHFRDNEPWHQMMRILDLPNHYQAKHFLGALDAAGQAAGGRVLVMIDALNEKHGLDIWPGHLAGMFKDIERYPHIALVLSCRTPWLSHIIPPELTEERLPRIEHHGFSEHGGEAARQYLRLRGITRPGAPNMLPEFNNPLFLKTCCDALKKDGKRTLPKGLRGVTSVFDFYTDAVARHINTNLKLNPRRRIPTSAIKALANMMAERGSEAIPAPEVMDLFDSILDSHGSLERSLMFLLESEGALDTYPVVLDDGSHGEMVRFTFQRYSDYFIAQKLLDDHLNVAEPTASFSIGTPLNDFITGNNAWRNAGVIEAMAVQLPERFGVELFDVIPEEVWPTHYYDQAFRDSLLWRAPEFFTQRTMELVTEHFDEYEVINTLISIATEPGNPFNAHHLHDVLNKMDMPKRDAIWSAHLAEYGVEEDSPTETLIDWSWRQGFDAIEDDRAELAAIALTWMLSTTNRAVRDRATKALTSLLAPRLHLASGLIDRFKNIDDPYILERLLAAVYGALMQGMTDDAMVAKVTQTVYDTIFAKDQPPANVLVRDSARGIHEYALTRGCLPATINIEKARPPYASPWPIEHVPDALIETYMQEYDNGHVGRDAIVGSAVNDGDFARYVIDYHVQDWSPAPFGTTELPTDREVYEAWLAEFDANAPKVTKLAYEVVQAALAATIGQAPYAKTPERAALNEAEANFRAETGDDSWEDYRVRAKGKLRHQSTPRPRKIMVEGEIIELPTSEPRPHTALFNTLWARRWVCKRAHDLGWSAELHGSFDRWSGRGYGRNDHRIERIGKKYQWLALYELRARMADNLAFVKRYEDSDDKYEGEWQVSLRDCDPSLLIDKTQNNGWYQNKEAVWWFLKAPSMVSVPPQERLDWLKSDADIIDGPGLLTVHNPKTGQDCLTLWGLASWSQKSRETEHRLHNIERDTWGRITCLVVRKTDEEQLLDDLKEKRLTDPHEFGRYEFLSTKYIGEYPWHPSFADYMDWEQPDTYRKYSVPIRQTSAEYMCESGVYDHSITQNVTVRLPAPWMMEAMGLKLSNGRDLTHENADGHIHFFDPSITTPGPQAALVDKVALLAMLEREGLTAVWIIAGEKSVYGGHNGFGGCRVYTSIYRLEDGEVTIFQTHVEWEEPSEDQLRKLLEQDDE